MATNQKEENLNIGFKEAMALLLPFIGKKIMEQIRSVFIIVTYLILFQTLALRIPIAEAAVIAGGIGLVIFGLAFFLEGLFLGLMPLGETLGIRLPQKSKLPTILIFAFMLGAGTTLAEPAIGVLKTAGSKVLPWEAPLLYLLLNRLAENLVYAVGIGVGIAVIFGMLRFLYNWSLKPLIFSLLGILLPLTVWSFFDPNMQSLTGLAWDCGAVTTGPVTVPLVVALGLGISRVTGDSDSGASGFGVVTLASLFPIIAVLSLGIFYLGNVPDPMTKSDFLNTNNNIEKIHYIFGDEKSYLEYKDHLINPIAKTNAPSMIVDPFQFLNTVRASFSGALQAIVPLVSFLLLFLLLILRERIRNGDEIFLGIFLAFIGMGIFNLGIELGLGKLGTQVGSKLPSAFRSIEIPESTRYLKNFDPEIVQTSINEIGEKEEFFVLKEKKSYQSVPFHKENYEESTGIYKYIPIHGPIYGKEDGVWGILVVLIFAFIMGYGATLAEPALNALGVTVEEITVGTFKKSSLMQSVSIGVGLGILFGVLKILFEIPIAYLLIPFYTVLLIITFFSTEEYVNIGWDSAGVTTGPITVPLVLALGLGVGGQIGVVEGFGILAMASVCPIISVLSIGLWVERNRKFSIDESNDYDEELDELISIPMEAK
ncbi:DUF1538 domain-containing protein [Leptospira sp. GIMC2001]|uniref:DUF1538 domain-containing protein n=1 Tax=Leptospira sp. GIMC2001 TaxID=1513297 RepID=UPI00234B0595|nr:DUF1538 domain-containing protein [Leptospira sp. GIMC2001]WCL48503.1 DUF1538 domain-containing protein [Leptospira sp. GIMC2001]